MTKAAPDMVVVSSSSLPASDEGGYVLRLYIAGHTPRSARAVANIRKICETHLEGRHQLTIVDLSRHPTLAAGEQIIAVPTLIKSAPPPLRRFIGDMSHTEKILIGLDLPAVDARSLAKPS